MKIFVVIDNFDLVRAQLDYGIALSKRLKANLVLYDLQQIPQLPSELRLTFEDYADSQMETKTLMHHSKLNLEKIVADIRRRHWKRTDYVLDINFFPGSESQYAISRNRLLELEADIVLQPKVREVDVASFISDYEYIASQEHPFSVLQIPTDINLSPWKRIYYLSRNVKFPSKNMKLVAQLANAYSSDVHIYFSSKLNKDPAVELAMSNESHFRKVYENGQLIFKLYRKSSSFDMMRQIEKLSKNQLIILEQDNPKYFSKMFRDWRAHRAVDLNPSPIMFLTHTS